MDFSLLVELVQKYGYFSMFLFNWLLLFGLPIPNEVAASFTGVLTELNGFNAIIAFISAYLGLITATLFAFSIGKFFGPRLITRLNRTRMQRPISSFSEFLAKRGNLAIGLSFFLPGIRWVMPYVVGANQISYITFLTYAVPSSMIWMIIYFQLGRTFPYAYKVILENIQILLITVSVLIICFLIIRYWINQHRVKKGMS
ncbi:MAG: DedA family protein [Paenisporosarcina sp.]